MVCFCVFKIIFGKWILFIPYLPSFFHTRKVSQEICFYSPSVLGMSCLFFSAAYGKCCCKHWEPWVHSSPFCSGFLLVVLFFGSGATRMWLQCVSASPVITLQTVFSLKGIECGCPSYLCIIILKIIFFIILQSFSWLFPGFLYPVVGGFHHVLFLTAFLNPHAPQPFLVKRIESLFISLKIVVRLGKRIAHELEMGNVRGTVLLTAKFCFPLGLVICILY